MKPRDVRRLILVDHALIRGLLTELEALLTRAAAGQRKLDGTAQRRARDLRRLFVAHLALEDNHLVPAVPRDAARLTREHDHQREHLEALLAHLAERRRPAPELVAELHDLVIEFLAGMRGEESAAESQDFLSGDTVPIALGMP